MKTILIFLLNVIPLVIISQCNDEKFNADLNIKLSDESIFFNPELKVSICNHSNFSVLFNIDSLDRVYGFQSKMSFDSKMNKEVQNYFGQFYLALFDSLDNFIPARGGYAWLDSDLETKHVKRKEIRKALKWSRAKGLKKLNNNKAEYNRFQYCKEFLKVNANNCKEFIFTLDVGSNYFLNNLKKGRYYIQLIYALSDFSCISKNISAYKLGGIINKDNLFTGCLISNKVEIYLEEDYTVPK